MARTKSNFVQATDDNISLGATVRNDNGEVGKISRWPKRGPLTITKDDGSTFREVVAKLEVDLNAPVTLAEASDGQPPAKATPVRQRAETVTRTVEGRTYTYQNLGGGKIDVGDAVAQELRGKPIDEVYAIAARDLGASVEELKAAYGSNNLGRQRMTLGNLMRASRKAKADGLTYSLPFRAEAEKAARKAEREAKQAAAKAEKQAKAEAAAKVKAEKDAERKAKAEAAAKVKAEKDAAAKAAKEQAAAKAKADKQAKADAAAKAKAEAAK